MRDTHPRVKYENNAGVVIAMQASIRQIQVLRQAKFGAEAVEGQAGGSGRGKVLHQSRKSLKNIYILESYSLRTSSICRLVTNTGMKPTQPLWTFFTTLKLKLSSGPAAPT